MSRNRTQNKNLYLGWNDIPGFLICMATSLLLISALSRGKT